MAPHAWCGEARPPGSATPEAEYAVTRTRASGGIGRRAGFRFLCPKGCGGSSPPSPTQKWTPGPPCGATGGDEPTDGTEPDNGSAADRRREEAQAAALFEFSIDTAPMRRTVPAVPGDLTTYKRAELLKARLRAAPARAGIPQRAAGVPTLAKVLPHRVALPPLPCAPVVALLDEKGRLKLRGALDLVGFAPGALHASRDGHWVVLRQPRCPGRPVRNAPRVTGDGRLTVPTALRLLLGVDVHGHVLVQPVPDAGALCLLNPAALLQGAPLGLLGRGHDQPAPVHGDRQGEGNDR